MSESQTTAVVLGVLLTGVVCFFGGVYCGMRVIQYQAVAYGHAEMRYHDANTSNTATVWGFRWKPAKEQREP